MTHLSIPSEEFPDEREIEDNPQRHVNAIRIHQPFSTHFQYPQEEICRARKSSKERSHPDRLGIQLFIVGYGCHKCFCNAINGQQRDIIAVDAQHFPGASVSPLRAGHNFEKQRCGFRAKGECGEGDETVELEDVSKGCARFLDAILRWLCFDCGFLVVIFLGGCSWSAKFCEEIPGCFFDWLE